MATGAEIIEPAAPSMEHASGMLEQIAAEFALGELKKPHVEMHQPLQATESTEELVITNGCKTKESVQVEYEGNGRALEGESFSESPPSAKVAAEQIEAGQARCEEADETSMQEKQPLGDVTVGEEHGHKTDEAELEVIKEEKTYRETSTGECAPVIEKEVSTLEKSANEIESEKFDVEYTERNHGEMKDAKPSESGPGLSLVKESEVGLHPEEATDCISGSTDVIDSVVVGRDEEDLTGQSKSVTEKPDCVPVAAEATIITEEETPSPSQVDGFQEAREDKDELDLPLIQEEETITSQPVEMETEERHEVSSCKPEEQVTEKDETPLLTETPTGDAYEAASAEIPVSIHPPAEEAREDKDELDLPLVQEEETITSQPVEMETEELHEVSSCKPEEQVTEKDETPLLMESPTEDADEAIKSAEIPVPIHPPKEEKLPVVVEEAGQLEREAGDTEIPKEQVDEDCEASSTAMTMAEDESKASKDAEDAIDKDHSLEQDISLVEGEKRVEDVVEENDSVFKAGGIADDDVIGCPAEEKNPLLIHEAEPLDSGENDTQAEKLDEVPNIRCKEQVTEENEAPMSTEAQAEDISEANESKEIAVPEQPSTEKEDLPQDQKDVETEELKTGSVDMEVEKLHEISNFESKEEGNGELEALLAREIQAEEEYETQRDSEGAIAEHSSLEKGCEQMTEETNASEVSVMPVTRTDATECLKEAEEEQPGIEIGHNTEAPSTSLEDCHSAEEVAPAADEKEAEITEPKEDTGNVVAFKDEATEASAALAEEHEVAPSAEKVSADEPLKCDGENSITVPPVCEGDIKEVKSGEEEPNTHDSTSEEAAPIEDEVGAEVKEPEIENHARSIDTHLEEIDTKEDDASNSDKVESDKHEEVTCNKLSTEIPENSLILLPPEEVIEANQVVAEAPEDDRKADEIPLQEEEKLKNENEENDGGEDICVTAETQSEEKIHKPEDEILMSNETKDVTGQSKMDEPKVSDESSPDQNMQAEEIEKAEPLPVSSLLEKAILEQSMASSENPVEELGEDHNPVNIEVDSKPDAQIIEEVIDLADTGKETHDASSSVPSLEEQGYEAISGTENDTLQEPSETPAVDDTDKIMDRECKPSEISETNRHETVDETTDAAEVIEEVHDEPEKATEYEKEVKVKGDINSESSPDSEVVEEKCVEEEEVQTTREVVETQEANLRSYEETIEAETQEKDSETTREVVSETEAPEISTGFEDIDEQKTCEEVTTSLEPEKQCKNDSSEEKVTSEEVRDAEILMRDASVDVTDQGKVDEPKETDENSANQNIQMDEGGCEKPGDEALNNAEPLPASSQTEDIILEKSTAPNDPDVKLREDDKPENVLVDSKPVADVIEEAIDSADTGASVPSSEDHGYEATSGTEQEAFQEPDEGPTVDDTGKIMDREYTPNEIRNVEMVEKVECTTGTERHETVNETTDATEVIEKHDEPEKAPEDEKEVKVQQDINLESSLDSEAGEERCVKEEEVQATREVVETQEANLRSHEGTIEAEKDSETTREVGLETEAPEISTEFEDADKQTSFEELTTSLEPVKQCDKTAEENDSTEEKVTSEQVRDACVDVTDQGKADEPKETDENSANQKIQMDEGGCEKPSDEAFNNAEPLPASSQTEKIILEENAASNNPDEELREDDKPENVLVDSKPVADIIEEVNDSADAEIICASEPASDDQSDDVLPEAKEDTLQKPGQGLTADNANEFTDQVGIPSVPAGIDGTTDAVELTEEGDDIEKADEKDKEVKVQDDVNTESVLVTEVREERSLEGEDVPASGAPEPEVEVSESVALTAPVEDEANDHCNKEAGKPETEVVDTETAQEVVSGTEVTELPAELEDADKQTSFEEATGSSEPEKLCEETSGAYDPVEEKASGEEVDDGEVKPHESESLEEREIDEVGDSKEIQATSPVEYAAVEEADNGPALEGTEAELENVHPEEIIAGGSECETTTEDLEKEKVPEGGSDSILETEDATEEASSNPTTQQCIPEQESAKKEQAVLVPLHELEGSEVAAEEACGSKHPETEVADAVDGKFEEEKSELTGITGEADGISREMDVSDSQCTESVSVEDTISDRSRELETQVLAPVSDVIPEIGESETAAMVEDTTEENEKGVGLLESEADKELPCSEKVAEIEEQQRTVDGDSEENEADTREATKVEDLGQEPLKEETETTHVDASVGEEAIATANVTDLSLEKAETAQEMSPAIQMEETVVSEDSESRNVNAVDANKPCENIVERSNDEEHLGVGDIDGSESVKQVIEKDCVPDERDFCIGSTDYDEAAAKVELPREENEEVSTVTNELSTKEEQAIPEVHCEQTVVPIEQPGTMVGVTEEENESLELSSAAEVAKDEYIEKDKQIEDVVSAANEATETRSLIFQEETVEASKEYENSVGADGVIRDDFPNEKDDIGHGKSHEGESSEDAKPTFEISSESLAVGEEGDSGIIPGEGISENEASASSVIAAQADNDDGQVIVSAAVADHVEEHVEEKVSEVAETPCEESNDAATLTTEATVVKSREAEKDEPVKESDRDILTDNALETDDIGRDGILVEEPHIPHGEAEKSTSIKEEVADKACITEEIHAAYEESDSISVPAEDIAAKDLDEQIQVGNSEPEVEIDTTADEQVSTSLEEVKEVKEVEKEIAEGAEAHCEKIDRDVPEISLSEADQDQKPEEQSDIVLEKGSCETAGAESGPGGEEIEEALPAVPCLSTEELKGTQMVSEPANGSIDRVEAAVVTEETAVKNTDVAGSELESRGVAEKVSAEAAELEETTKEVELRHDENLQPAPAQEAVEEACSEKAREISTEATESASVTDEVEETTKEVELLHDENPQSAPVPEAVEEICLEKAKEISTEAAEPASVAEETEQTTKEVELRHDENLQSASPPMQAEEACSEKAEEVIAKTSESVYVTEEIEESKREVELRHEEDIQLVPAPESADETFSEKVEEVTTNTAEPVSVTEEIDETAKEVELRHDQNVESAFTPEATEEVCSEKTEEMSTRAIESVSVTEEVEETTKVLEARHNENLQSAPAPEPAEEVFSENAEEMSTKAAESQLDTDTHTVSNQLEDAEIIEKHFEVANSVAVEQSEKIADEVSPGIALAEKPVYPFVEEQESRQPHTVVAETSEEIHEENKLKDEEVLEEKMETLTSTVNELRNQEEKIFKVEDEPARKEVGDINGEIVQEEKVSTEISEGEGLSESSLCKTMETVIPTGKEDAVTIEKPEESILGPETETPHLPEHGRSEVVCTPGGKALEEPADGADVPLSDLLKKPVAETLQATTRAVETSDAVESSLEAETNKAEEAKTHEARDEHEADEDDHREHSPEHESPVMVESSKDTDVKTPHKKSHNILSGVGSKVKHSISKVKKAITGKSSHSKTASPPKQSS